MTDFLFSHSLMFSLSPGLSREMEEEVISLSSYHWDDELSLLSYT